MIDRVLCALLFKCTAFGLHPGNSRLSLSLSLQLFAFFFFTLLRYRFTRWLRSDLYLYCVIHSDVSPCVLSVDWKSTDCNSDYERFVLFERFFLFFPAPIVVLSREFVYAMSQCLWFRRIVGLSLVFSLSLFQIVFLRIYTLARRNKASQGFFCFQLRVSNFEFSDGNFDEFQANLVPDFRESIPFSPLFFNFFRTDARVFRRMDGSRRRALFRRGNGESVSSRVQ